MLTVDFSGSHVSTNVMKSYLLKLCTKLLSFDLLCKPSTLKDLNFKKQCDFNDFTLVPILLGNRDSKNEK